MVWDYEFIDGFDKYGPIGTVLFTTSGTFPTIMSGEWTTNTSTSNGQIQGALGGTGGCLQLNSNSGSGGQRFVKTVPNNFAEFIGGMAVQQNTIANTTMLMGFHDSGTPQFSLCLESDGTIGARRGTESGTLIAKSTQTLSPNTTFYIEWDIVIHNSAGVIKVWLNGVLTSLNLTSQNTRGGTANNYANQMSVSASAGNSSVIVKYDHLYQRGYLATGSGDTPLLTNPLVETQFPTSDSSVQFTASAGVIGQDYSITGSTNAPGANKLYLRRFAPTVNCTIQSVSQLPQTTSATAKFKAVIYADSGGNPNGAPLSSGNEVTGVTANTLMTGTLVTPQALTGGTFYHIGFICDTSITLTQVDTVNLNGEVASNTYGSGAPTTPTMTGGQVPWIIFGNVTGPASNYSQVGNEFSNPPLSDLSFNSDSTVNHEDLFGFPALPSGSLPTSVAVKGWIEKSDAGARTMDLRTKSSTTDSAGSNAGFSPSTSYQWFGSYFDTDPNGSIAWTKAAVDAATSGYKIAS